MIAHPSLHLFPCSPASPIFIIVYMGRKRVRLRLHLQVISHRILEESISSIAIQIIRRVSELQRTSDVRKGFVDHLYHAHTSWGLLVFLDTHEINRGEGISATLYHAIEWLKVVAAAPTLNNPSMATNLPAWQDITDRWKPTLEQKTVLESIHKSGIHSPTLTEIESIANQLQMHGEVEEKNVSYWFHNSNAAGGEKEIPNTNAAAAGEKETPNSNAAAAGEKETPNSNAGGEKEIPNSNAAAAAGGEKEIPRKKKTSQLLPSQPEPEPAPGESVLWASNLLTNASPISAPRTQCTDEVKMKPSLFLDHSCSFCESVERIPTIEVPILKEGSSSK